MRTGGGFSHVATIEKRSFDGGIVDDSASTTDAQETVNGTWARNLKKPGLQGARPRASSISQLLSCVLIISSL